ncbi:MAG: family 10 glycosylhydrolase [Bacteroidales bacterium]
MYRKYLFFILPLAILGFLTQCSTTKPLVTGDPSGRTPSAVREFRAAWVATVANINWPSKPGIPVEQQKREALQLLDMLHENNFNAVVFQVRPQCDALYKSDLEPWSYYLTGEQGKAPDPYYDPLEFWIEESHKRGIELHAWLNPYRAHHVSGGPVSDASIVKRKPELALFLETGYWWLDPSLQGTQDHSYDVVIDLVQRYDLDGIHFDDYFYPYPDYNNFKDFPDDASWEEYLRSGGKLSRSDWRRESVNTFIERLYKGIKAEKPHVKFGLSPFGIWRPYNPPGVSGFDQHEVLYADARLWLNKGWIDYYSPQLYWPVGQLQQSYPVLLGWWAQENRKNRHLWPGISIDRFQGERAIDEVTSQIMIARGMLPNSPGVIHWSIGPLIMAPPLAKAISSGPYQKQALVPPSPWLSRKTPLAPEVALFTVHDSVKVTWSHPC